MFTNIKKQPSQADRGVSAGKINLMLTGFAEQDKVPTDTIVDCINRIPDAHLAGLKEICFDPEQLLLKYALNDPYAKNIHSKGIYIMGIRTIAIFEFNNLDKLLRIMYHEIGHYVYYTIINSQVKKRWVTEAHRIKRYVSKYASVNASEDFAESYAEYLINPANLRRIPQKYEFIHTAIFKRKIGQVSIDRCF